MLPRIDPAEIQLGELLARGARGCLYHATWRGSHVVLKVLADSTTAADAERLEHEGEIAARVASDDVVVMHGITQNGGRPALVMAHFGDGSLDAVLPGPLAIETFLRIAIGIARGLRAVHDKGVIHGDVKPKNILVETAALRTKLADFGAATLASGSMSARDRGWGGTLPYLAPEQTGRTTHRADCRADLYSFGVTLFELLVGQRPFEASDPLEWIHAHLAKAPPVPSKLRPSVPDTLSALVLRLLAKSPEGRYQSIRGVLADLERCLAAWLASGVIPTFTLAADDVGEELIIPDRLFGRDREREILHRALARTTASPRPSILLVGGRAGVGKSALVDELDAAVTQAGKGLFVRGKFDQLRQAVPYAAVGQAIAQLVAKIEAFPREQRAAWTSTITRALGEGASVMTRVFPVLEDLLGPADAVATLGAAEAQNRMHLVAQAMFRALADAASPLVVVFDDMQWADDASLALIASLANPANRAALLLVLAYRDDEIDAGHPFTRCIAQWRTEGATIEELAITPLDPSSVTALVAAAIDAPPAECEELARLVRDKTGGNPFFVREMLRTLHGERLLTFDATARAWRWNGAAIAARDLSDNVVELMIARLRRLPASVQQTLEVAACMGNQVAVQHVVLAAARPAAEVLADLTEAERHGLVAPLTGTSHASEIRFQHDRIQQAAYALLAAEERPETHLRIGRALLDGLSAAQLDRDLFAVVQQLAKGATLVSDPAERARLSTLNASAGRRAKAAVAHAQARTYFSLAVSLLGDGAWDADHDAAFDLHTELAECEYLSGALEASTTRFSELIDRARTDLERGRVFYLQVKLFQVAGDFERAVAVAIDGFRLFGLDPPTEAGAAAACEIASREVDELLAGREIDSLLDLPEVRDPRVRAAADLLEASGPPLYMVMPSLFAWIALQLLTLSLKHGNSEASTYGYGIYGILRAGASGDVDGGLAFGQLAIRLNDKLHGTKLRGCLLHFLGDHVNFWKNHIASDLPILERGFRACLEGGDLIYSNYIGFQGPWHAYEAGSPLADVGKMIERYLAFARQSRHAPVVRTLELERRFVNVLQGTGGAGIDVDVDLALREIEAARFGSGIAYHHVLELVRQFTFGDADGALASAVTAESSIGAAFSMPMQVTYFLYHALALAEVAPKDDDARGKRAAVLADYQARFTGWSRACPTNFAFKLSLVSGALARTEGRALDALRSFERATTEARAHGFVQYEALAHELAAKVAEGEGLGSMAAVHLHEARALYRRWGATAKAASLESGGVAPIGHDRVSRDAMRSASSGSSSSGALDLLSVVKASQTISSEIVLPRLLEKLIAIVVEYAGAAHGHLILVEDGELRVVASSNFGAADTASGRARGNAARALEELVPASVLARVRTTRQRILVDDASQPNPFSADPYIAARRPRSVLCAPILRHGELAGMFYLENNLLAAAFAGERLTALDLLAAQTAISIDNSKLYEASQEAIRIRDEFLSLASHELKTPLTPLKLRLQMLMDALEGATLPGSTPERLRDTLVAAERQVTRLGALVDDLLDVSRLQQGSVVLSRERLDLTALVRAAVERHRPKALEAGCDLELDGDGAVMGEWDRARLDQVLAKLLANAFRYAPGKPILARVRAAGSGAELTIADRGPGVLRKDRLRIFERGERGTRGEHVQGIGLGLYIAQQVVRAHGGTIHVQEHDGGGAAFVVTLPGATEARGD